MCVLSDVAEAVQALGTAWNQFLPVSSVQDKWAAGYPLHHRPLHQLCHWHADSLRQTPRALDWPWGGPVVSAGWLVEKASKLGVAHSAWHAVCVCGSRCVGGPSNWKSIKVLESILCSAEFWMPLSVIQMPQVRWWGEKRTSHQQNFIESERESGHSHRLVTFDDEAKSKQTSNKASLNKESNKKSGRSL